MAPLMQAASRKTTNSNPSLEMSVTYLLSCLPFVAILDADGGKCESEDEGLKVGILGANGANAKHNSISASAFSKYRVHHS